MIDIFILISLFVLALAAILLMATLCKRLVLKMTVFEYEKAVHYHKGQLKGILDPGQYWMFLPTNYIEKIDVRPSFITIPNQEILTTDHIPVKISLIAGYEVVDPYTTLNKTTSYHETLYLTLQLAIRQLVSSLTVDELLQHRYSYGDKLLELSKGKTNEIGIDLSSVDIKDVMLPSDLKKAYAQAVKEQKEGLAALEKARTETARLRSLANAAKIMDNNGMLAQLRLIQAIEQSTGNSFVMGTSEAPANNKKRT